MTAAALVLTTVFVFQITAPVEQVYADDHYISAMAVDQTVSGVGKQTNGSFHLDPGLVTLEVTYSGNSIEPPSTSNTNRQFNLLLKKEGSTDFKQIILENCGGRTFTKKITLASYQAGRYGIQAFAAVNSCNWSVKVTQKAKKAVPSGVQNYANNSFSGSGAKSVGSFYLLPGTCTVKISYSNNIDLYSESDKTNFITWLRSEDVENNKCLVLNEIANAGSTTKTATIKQAGWFYLDVDSASPAGNWKITIIPKKKAAPNIKAEKKQMTVSWKKLSSVTGVEKYQVRYRMEGTSKWKTTKTIPRSKNSITIKKLKPGTKYEVQLRAYNKIGKITCKDIWSKSRTSDKIKK